ncbi:MAG: pyrimidine-nucleoside phosphorylase [Clostridia bacterium]|nr:pyrimidine-nucleoside phosphorylase [Clostridia bacterium]
MRMYDIIKKKRDGGELSQKEIEFFIRGYVDGSVPDYQASAFCMAVFFTGMTEKETADLTAAMAESGDTIDLSRFGTLTADKHSTGGVGDKTTLIVAPICASLGCVMAKMSGRGLGHTGGTIDKLESIEGFNTALSPQEFFEQVEKTGLAVVGQTGNLTPADKKLYALRDVTATVDSMPLIASSIMSKKLAAGAHTIVLDVKCGSGAFMKTREDAEKLAIEMVKIGNNCGRNTAAVISNMDRPLGRNIGNSLEVIEAIEILTGKGPDDLKEVCLTLATQILSLSKNIPETESRKLTENALASGKAFEKFKEWISSQGGNTAWIDNTDLFPKALFSYEIKADKDGYISKIDAEAIGIAAVILGAGREKKDDTIDMSAGIILNKKTGDKVSKGDVIATLYSCNQKAFDSAEKQFMGSLEFSKNEPNKEPLIYKVIK